MGGCGSRVRVWIWVWGFGFRLAFARHMHTVGHVLVYCACIPGHGLHRVPHHPSAGGRAQEFPARPEWGPRLLANGRLMFYTPRGFNVFVVQAMVLKIKSKSWNPKLHCLGRRCPYKLSEGSPGSEAAFSFRVLFNM